MLPPDALPPGATPLDTMLEDILRRRYLVVDGQGRISRWSAGAEQLLGWQEQEVVGRSAFGQPLAWAGDGMALWQSYLESSQLRRPPTHANLMMLCRGGWGLSVDMTAVPVPLVLGYEFTMLVADLAVGGPGFETAEQLAQMHPLAYDAIASALDEDSPPVDAVAGLVVTLHAVSEAAVIEDTDAQHAARALAAAVGDARPGPTPVPNLEPDPEPEPAAAPVAPPAPDPELASLRAQLEALQSERDGLEAELRSLPDKSALTAAKRDRDEARAALAAALAERDRAAEALDQAAGEREAAEAALRETEAGHRQQEDELRRRVDDAEHTAAERAAEVEVATREAAEQRERVAAGHLATEALARERARVSELESQIAMLSRRLDRAGERAAIPRKRPFESGLDDIESPRAYIALDGRFTALNESFCKLVGYSEAEFSTAYWPPVIDAEHRSTLRRTTARLIAGRLSSSDVDTVYMSGTGDLVRVVGTIHLERDESGAPRQLILDAQPLSAVTA